jgi:hypothetical protein
VTCSPLLPPLRLAGTIAAALLLHAAALLAQAPAAEPALRWVDLATLPVEGRGWGEEERRSFYDRLPAKAEGVVPQPVWNLSRHSTGMHVRFVTDATAIHVRWTLTSDRLAMPHMPATGVSGVDLYVKATSGQWRWLAAGQPREKTNAVELISRMPPGPREYLLYLPLANGVAKLEIGVPEAASLQPAGPWGPGERKPVVFYGTSILNGYCASRPGMVHSSILGRRFHYPTMNFGFSGNGRMEIELANLLAEIDASVYVLDCLPNMGPEGVSERVEPFVLRLRQSHPGTPIVLVEDRIKPNAHLMPNQAQFHQRNHAALRGAYERLLAAGVSNLHYIEGADLLGDDFEGTVDNSHPTDLGFMRQAEVFALTLGPLLEDPRP